MSVIQLIKEADKLEAIDRKRLMAHLVLLRLKENEEYRNSISDRIENKDNPDNWVALEDIEKKYQSS